MRVSITVFFVHIISRFVMSIKAFSMLIYFRHNRFAMHIKVKTLESAFQTGELALYFE